MSCYRKDTIYGTLRLRFKRRSYYYTFTPCTLDDRVSSGKLTAIQATVIQMQALISGLVKNNVPRTTFKVRSTRRHEQEDV